MAQPVATVQRGEGWLLYSSIILLIVGTLNLFQGLALISKDQILVTDSDASTVVIGNVSAWGWVILIVGFIEIVASFGVLVRVQWARWFAIFVASLAVIAQFPVFFGPHPLWSFTVMLLAIFVIYGLATYGGRDSRSA